MTSLTRITVVIVIIIMCALRDDRQVGRRAGGQAGVQFGIAAAAAAIAIMGTDHKSNYAKLIISSVGTLG